MMISKRRVKLIWLAILMLAIIGGIVFSLFYFVPFYYQKQLVDSIAADGQVESFTREIYIRERSLSGIIAILFFIASGLMIIYKSKIEEQINQFLPKMRKFMGKRGQEFHQIITSLSPSKQDYSSLIILLLITSLGVLFRYAFLWRPMGHDEAYTFMAFASRGFWISITDYHLPNNHVFHTILVNLASELFGNSPAIIRLPAFLAGVFIIPATYLVGKQYFYSSIGLVSASIVASIPVLIDYSTTARGYTFLALFTLVIVAVSEYVRSQRNLIAWGLLIVFSSLGLYTNPTMIYPIGMVLTWLLISNLVDETSEDYGQSFYSYFGAAVVMILFLTGVLYSPIIINSGIQPLFNNDVIEPLTWTEFYQSIPVRIKNTWAEWNRNLPDWISTVAIIGLISSFFVPRINRKNRITLILSSIVWISTALIVQRVAPWPRIWLFLLPLIIILISAGLLGLVELISSRIFTRKSVVIGAAAALIVLSLWAGMSASYVQFTQKISSRGEVEEVALFLSEYLRPEDLVVVTSPDRIVLQYYLTRHNISQGVTEISGENQYSRAIVVVNKGHGQTMDYVINWRTYLDGFNLGPAEEIYKTDRFSIFKLPIG